MKALLVRSWACSSLAVASCNTFDAPPKRQTPTPSFSPTFVPFPPTPTFDTTTTSPCGVQVDYDGDGVKLTQRSGCSFQPPIDGAAEDCNDFDPSVSESWALYQDDDGDGLGDPTAELWVCEGLTPEGFVPNSDDCDDRSVYSGVWQYRDEDGDGFGDALAECRPPESGWSPVNGDCADDAAFIHPDATPDVAFDGVDVNCDGFDVPVAGSVEQQGPFRWDEPVFCPSGALAVVGVHLPQSTLIIANVGLTQVSAATLVLEELDPLGNTVQTRRYPVLTLNPGMATTWGPVYYGSYRATFAYEATDASAATNGPAEDAGGRADAAFTSAHDDAATRAAPPDLDSELCQRAQLPMLFTSYRSGPIL